MEEIIIYRHGDLDRLQFWLTVEISTSIFYFFSFSIIIFLWVIVMAAFLFTPFLLKVLLKEKKYGWVFTFLLFIVSPIFLVLISSLTNFYKETLIFIPIGLFYLYCFTLRFAVRDWVSENNAKYQREIDKNEESLDYFVRK